jgi:acetyltransferase-like isoleucine patch superfamily enzyme
VDDGNSTGSGPFLHPLADVQTDRVGPGTRIWQFVVVLHGATIGRDCNICSHCFVENDVVIGDRVTIKSGVQLWDGISIEDDVFIGPNVSFSNDRYPRSRATTFNLERTVIERGVSIGAGAVLLPGLRVGHDAVIAAGAIVTKDVESGATVMGNPARPR